MDPDQELCLCFHVSQRKVVNYLKREQPAVASQLTECLGAGTGCGWCCAGMVSPSSGTTAAWIGSKRRSRGGLKLRGQRREADEDFE